MGTAFAALQGRGDEKLQSFLDETCSLMSAAESPGHSITVTAGERSFVANPAVHANHLMDADARVVIGTFDRGDVHVEVGETLAPVLMTAVRAGAWRLVAILLAGLLAAALLNVLLLHLVTRPLERLAGAVRAIGRGTLDTTVPAGANSELDGLAREITAMSRDLGQRESARRAQLARSRRLQAHLNSASHQTNGMSFCIEYHPADEVAGDFVDVIACGNGDTLVCLADVVGHGIHAAMEAAVLKALLLSISINDYGPASILRVLNEKFCLTSLSEDFASMVMLRVSQDGSRVTYANAGHEPGLIRSATGSYSIIRSTGLLLGVTEDSEYEEESVELNPGDVIVLLSDGITESQSAEGKLLGRVAVRDAISSVPVSDARLAALAALQAARRHRGDIPSHDDETVVAVGMKLASNGNYGRAGQVSHVRVSQN